MRILEALFSQTLILVSNNVRSRIICLLFSALLLGARLVVAAGGGVDGPEALGDDANPSAPAFGDTAPDTTYLARFDTLTVVGRRSVQKNTATRTSAGRASDGSSSTENAGGTHNRAGDVDDTTLAGVAIGGLISNETFSVVGARFARAFNDKWTEPEDAEDMRYTMTLGENPAPRRGAQVLVEVEGTTLFEGYLRPNRRQIQQAAQRAVRRATLYLQKYYEAREVY